MRIPKSPRLLAMVAVVVGILAVALWPSAIEIDVATVGRGAMQVTIDEEGETRVRERFVVSAPVMGRVERIELEPGDPVVRGKTVVARLMPAAAPLIDVRTQGELAAAVEVARAAVGQAQAEQQRAAAMRTRAQSTAARLQTLMKTGAISGDELEAAQTTLRSAEEAVRAGEFAVARAEHELQLARARLKPSGAGGGLVYRGCAGRWRRAEAAARERDCCSYRRTPARDWRSRESRNRLGSALDGRRARKPRCSSHHRPVGRQRPSRRTRPPRGAIRLHEGVCARCRGAARQRSDRLCRRGRPGQPRRRLSRRGAHRDVARPGGSQGASRRA